VESPRRVPQWALDGAKRLPPTVRRAGGTALRRAGFRTDERPAPRGAKIATHESIVDGERDDESFETGLNEQRWFGEKVASSRRIIGFLTEEGETTRDKAIADIGCGSGFMTLGLAAEANARSVVGFDLNPVDRDELLAVARRQQYCDELPASLDFRVSTVDRITADDGTYDLLVSWSCFEHVADPVGLARDMRRVVVDGGRLYLQLWPFYHSPHGAHLQDWYPEGFVHLTRDADEIQSTLLRNDVGPDGWGQYKWSEYVELNELTLDGLQAALTQGGFRIDVVELIAQRTHLPADLPDLPLSLTAVSGVELLATAI
jgi:SAM-dependent methyltransferase